MAQLSTNDLDQILAVQLLLAWAGETPGGGHPRLGWWRTDVIDEEGGGDLWKRLLPRTHQWAGLDAARRAAYRTDESLRRHSKSADHHCTLFHFGFEIDEALDERLAHHVLEAKKPPEVLPLLRSIGNHFERAAMVKTLAVEAEDTTFKTVPGGRQLKKVSGQPLPLVARRLAAGLLSDPLAKTYPVAFVLEELVSGKR